jgi:hypothetical protein
MRNVYGQLLVQHSVREPDDDASIAIKNEIISRRYQQHETSDFGCMCFAQAKPFDENNDDVSRNSVRSSRSQYVI